MFNKSKSFKIAVAVAAMILLLSVSAYAVIALMSASDVATHFGEKELAVLFEESAFEPETIKGDEYSVAFLGMAPGTELYEIDGVEINENRTYAVLAVYRNDGIALKIIDGCPIQVVPVVQGYKPDTLFDLGMSAHRTEKDGVIYCLLDYTDLEVFADKNVSLIAFEGEFPTGDILKLNGDGNIVYADGYNGFKGEFELNLDESKADAEKALELINGR